jgi:hypothetical protein
MSEALKVIAEKLGENTSDPLWVSNTINKACTLIERNKCAVKELERLRVEEFRLRNCETLILGVLASKYHTDSFKAKIRKEIKERELEIKTSPTRIVSIMAEKINQTCTTTGLVE